MAQRIQTAGNMDGKMEAYFYDSGVSGLMKVGVEAARTRRLPLRKQAAQNYVLRPLCLSLLSISMLGDAAYLLFLNSQTLGLPSSTVRQFMHF